MHEARVCETHPVAIVFLTSLGGCKRRIPSRAATRTRKGLVRPLRLRLGLRPDSRASVSNPLYPPCRRLRPALRWHQVLYLLPSHRRTLRTSPRVFRPSQPGHRPLPQGRRRMLLPPFLALLPLRNPLRRLHIIPRSSRQHLRRCHSGRPSHRSQPTPTTPPSIPTATPQSSSLGPIACPKRTQLADRRSRPLRLR